MSSKFGQQPFRQMKKNSTFVCSLFIMTCNVNRRGNRQPPDCTPAIVYQLYDYFYPPPPNMPDRYAEHKLVLATILDKAIDSCFEFSLPSMSAGEREYVMPGVRPTSAPKRTPDNIIFRREVTEKDIMEFVGDGVMSLQIALAMHQLIPKGCDYDVSCLASSDWSHALY